MGYLKRETPNTFQGCSGIQLPSIRYCLGDSLPPARQLIWDQQCQITQQAVRPPPSILKTQVLDDIMELTSDELRQHCFQISPERPAYMTNPERPKRTAPADEAIAPKAAQARKHANAECGRRGRHKDFIVDLYTDMGDYALDKAGWAAGTTKCPTKEQILEAVVIDRFMMKRLHSMDQHQRAIPLSQIAQEAQLPSERNRGTQYLKAQVADLQKPVLPVDTSLQHRNSHDSSKTLSNWDAALSSSSKTYMLPQPQSSHRRHPLQVYPPPVGYQRVNDYTHYLPSPSPTHSQKSSASMGSKGMKRKRSQDEDATTTVERLQHLTTKEFPGYRSTSADSAMSPVS